MTDTEAKQAHPAGQAGEVGVPTAEAHLEATEPSTAPKDVKSSEEEEEDDDDENEEDDEDEDDEDEEEDDDDDGDDEDDEPTLKYARLTPHLSAVYRNGDATSSFLVAGDKMIAATHDGNIVSTDVAAELMTTRLTHSLYSTLSSSRHSARYAYTMHILPR